MPHKHLHSTEHTNGTDDIQSATNAQKGLATAAQITALESALTQIAALEKKYDAEQFDPLETYKGNQDQVWFEGGSYRCIIDTLVGESPTTHPAKWDIQDKTVHDIEICVPGPADVSGGDGAGSSFLEAMRTCGGKFIWEGKDIRVIYAMAKFGTPSTTSTNFDIARGSTGDYMFDEYVSPSATADEYGAKAITPFAFDRNRINTGEEINFYIENTGSLDGLDITFKLRVQEV